MLNSNKAYALVYSIAPVVIICGCGSYEPEDAIDYEAVEEVSQAVVFTPLPLWTWKDGHVDYTQQAYYQFSVKKNYWYTVTMMTGYTNNDPDLYTSKYSSISPSSWQCRPYLGPGQTEKCNFQAPDLGVNYVMVRGASDDCYFGLHVAEASP